MKRSLLWFTCCIAILLGPSSVLLAHNYMAPYLYLSGVYSPTGKRITYSRASDAEMAYILKQIKDKDRNVRVIAAGALGQANDPRAVEPLLSALQDRFSGVRMNAAMALFHVKDARCIQPLKRALRDEEGGWDDLAMFALVAQGDEGIKLLIDLINSSSGGEASGYSDHATMIADAICLDRGSDAVKWAAAAVKGPSRVELAIGIWVLNTLSYGGAEGEVANVLSDNEVIERLILIAKDAHGTQADAAWDVLSRSRDARAKAFVEKRRAAEDAAETSDQGADGVKALRLSAAEIKRCAKDVRAAKGKTGDEGCLDAREAASMLARASSPAGIEVLVKILNEKNAIAARVAANALLGTDDPKAAKAIQAVLGMPEHSAYRQVVQGLARMGPVSAKTRLLQSNDGLAVRETLMYVNEDDGALVKYLLPLLNRPEFRMQAALALAKFRDPLALDVLVELLGPRDKSEHAPALDALLRYGSAATDKVLSKLADASPKAKEGASLYFTSTREPRAVDPLLALLADSNVAVRRQAILALAFQQDAKARPRYVAALGDSDSLVRRCAARQMALDPDESASDALLTLLSDKDDQTRTCAAIALGRMGDGRGADLIVSSLTLPDLDDEEADELEEYAGVYLRDAPLLTSAIKAAGKLKEKRVAGALIALLPSEVRMSVFDGGTEQELLESRSAKLDALRAITGQDFGYAFYRWMAWWTAQGNKPVKLFPNM